MKKINHLISALIMAAMTAGFASCSSSDEPSSVSDNTPKELTLTIMSTKPVTKAALDGSSAPTDTQEKTINRITVGIFSSDGSEVRTIQEFGTGTTTASEATAGSGKFYNPGNGSATVTVVTTKMAAGDKVAIAINAPSNLFNGVQNLSDFKAKEINADIAIANETTSPVATTIPMYGENTATDQGNNNFSTTINVSHLTAKVTLESLSVNFDPNGPYSDASFTPTEIFLHSVPDGLLVNSTSPYKSTSVSYYTGESSTDTGLTEKEYLSSGTPTAQELKTGSATFSTKYYFYTTPNDQTDGNKTRLVIKGKFKTTSSDTGVDVYYPVKLNYEVKADGTTDVPSGEQASDKFKVLPNKNYKCTVVIKTKGATDPSSDIDPTTATITIKVASFTDVSQETVFQ